MDKLVTTRISWNPDRNIRIKVNDTMVNRRKILFIWEVKYIYKGKLMEKSKEYKIVLNFIKLQCENYGIGKSQNNARHQSKRHILNYTNIKCRNTDPCK
jgi:hypothetical protein